MSKKQWIKNSWDQPLPEESNLMFQRYLIYRNLPTESRTVNTVWNIIKEKNTKSKAKKRTISLTQLRDVCTRNCWVERAELYDYHQHLKEVKKNEKDFNEQSQNAKKIFKKVMSWADTIIDEIGKSEYALTSKIRMMQDLTHTTAKAHEQFRLACGKSTNNNFNDNKFSGEVALEMIGKENIHEVSDEDLELILGANEDTDEFTDKL